ncbi:WSSV207 [White spot syndrome virus]|uniref:WSSV207 n=1 Tax=White spot syndrome virus TaxID=342409 RepID=A0A2I6SBV8_9VIRU|nr:WSSV207 [White spot syndrome virus]
MNKIVEEKALVNDKNFKFSPYTESYMNVFQMRLLRNVII